jgi:nucleotide-binding universal stress UspA family protein
MKKILVPTDFSKTSITAAEVAADIAQKDGSTVLFLNVIEEATDGSFNVGGEVAGNDFRQNLYNMKLIEKAKKQLDKLQADSRFANVKTKGILRLGNPFHGMREIITEQKVDLVVMGTTGKTKLEEVLVGSNTERVIRYSRSPVLTIHKKPANTNFKNIVYATAMSKEEEVFSKIVRRAQELYKSTIHLVRINTPGDFQADYTVKTYMEKFAKKLQLKNYTINVFNDYTPEDGIIHFADSVDGDLIAMATHGRRGFAHVLTGSVAEGVAGQATRPVLTFVVTNK